MKVKQLVEKLEKLDQEEELMLFIRDEKRPHLGSGTIIPIKNISIFTSIDQDSNKEKYLFEIEKDDKV
jgi:exosome complex RNA-binding protein Rrp4